MHSTLRSRRLFALTATPLLALLLASTATPVAYAQSNADTAAQDNDTPAAPFDPNDSTPEEKSRRAWTILTDAANDKHSLVRVQALAALGNLGGEERAQKLILDALVDPDVDVRTAAVLAAGQSHQLVLIGRLHDMLNDKEPQVAFAAATTLWKLKDYSGEDILMAVANGDRAANAGLVDGARHTVNKDFHNPSTLTRVGALEGASLLLGPFGFGLGALEAMRKNGGNSARVTAIEQLSQEHTGPVRAQLLSAITDKDPSVRAAAAKALGEYHEEEVSDQLANLFIDTKPPVRYTGAAAYLRSVSPAPAKPAEPAVAKPAKSTKPASKK